MNKGVEKFRKIHPKATKGLSDDEVIELGDAITAIHEDKTPRKFQDVFCDENGQRYLIVNDGKEEIVIPIFKSKGVKNG